MDAWKSKRIACPWKIYALHNNFVSLLFGCSAIIQPEASFGASGVSFWYALHAYQTHVILPSKYDYLFDLNSFIRTYVCSSYRAESFTPAQSTRDAFALLMITNFKSFVFLFRGHLSEFFLSSHSLSNFFLSLSLHFSFFRFFGALCFSFGCAHNNTGWFVE